MHIVSSNLILWTVVPAFCRAVYRRYLMCTVKLQIHAGLYSHAWGIYVVTIKYTPHWLMLHSMCMQLVLIQDTFCIVKIKPTPCSDTVAFPLPVDSFSECWAILFISIWLVLKALGAWYASHTWSHHYIIVYTVFQLYYSHFLKSHCSSFVLCSQIHYTVWNVNSV